MTHDQPDPADLAASVRELANGAGRALNDPGSTRAELYSLLGQAVALQGQMQGWPSGELSRWLENLRGRLNDV